LLLLALDLNALGLEFSQSEASATFPATNGKPAGRIRRRFAQMTINADARPFIYLFLYVI